MNEQQCLARFAQTRDAQAFRVLVEQYQRLVYSAASRRLGNSHDVEDVVQSTFLKLAKAAGTIRNDLASWLYITTINTANDLIRRDQSRRRREALSAAPESVIDDERAEWNQLSVIIDQVLLELPAPQRSILVEHFLRGRSQRDLAEEMKVSQPTVLRRINAAVDELRGQLAGLGYTTAAPVLVSMLEKIPQPPVPASVTAELVKIGLSGVPSASFGTNSKLSGSMVMKLGLVAVVLIALPTAAFFLLTRPPPTPSSAAMPPSQFLHGRILKPDGSPASGATVFIALPGPSQTRIRNGVADVIDPRSPKTVTDASGEYSLPSQQGQFLLVALDVTGFAQADQDAVARKADIRLTGWGRLHGRLMLGIKAAAGIELIAGYTDSGIELGPVQVPLVGSAQTDALGNFTMDRLVPGTALIYRNITQQSGANTMVFSGAMGHADVSSGKIASATFGGVGRPVAGQLSFTPGMNAEDFFINARAIMQRKPSATSQPFLGVAAIFLEVDPQHHFRIDNVTPGDYKIHIFLQRIHGDRTVQPDEPTFTMPPIPGGVSDEPLVIPDIHLR